MGIKQDIPQHIQKIIDNIDGQIEVHKSEITKLELSKKMWLTHQPTPVKFVKQNSPLTRDLIRNILSNHDAFIQTVTLIDIIYKGKTDEERNKLIKHLSVMLNQMVSEGEMIMEKRKGVKGNFYKPVKK